MDPIIDAFTARYLGVPVDEYLHVTRGLPGRRDSVPTRRRLAPGHRPVLR
jgi:hypothetical protein